VREPRRLLAGAERGRDHASADGDIEPSADGIGDTYCDAVTHPESDGIADARSHKCPCQRDREPFAGRGCESAGDRGRQRNELPALRDADRDRVPRPALALPLARRSAPLSPANLDEPRDEQRRGLDEVVEEVQVRSRDRQTAEEQTA